MRAIAEVRGITRKENTSVLRIGIMLNSFNCQSWVAKILTEIQNSSFARIVLIIRNASMPIQQKKGLQQRLKGYWTHGLFNWYQNWDRKRHKLNLDSFSSVNVTDVLKDVPVMSVAPVQKGFVDRIAPEDCARIAESNLDVLFRFGFRIIRGEILSCAEHGVWSFHHGDNREYRGAPPGFWEIYERNPVTGSILQILTESLDGGHVIHRSFSATNFDSLYLSLNPMYWKTAEFAVRRLRDLHRHGGQFLQQLPEYNEPNSYRKKIYRTPSAPVMLRFLLRGAPGRFGRRVRSLIQAERHQWFIAIRPRTGLRTILNDRKDFQPLLPPRNRFYADPFLIERNGKTYLFFEDFDFLKNRAAISYVEIGHDDQISAPRRILEKDYHLSYPFLFEQSGEVYMIPETRERRTIELYRATPFPEKWDLVRVLTSNVSAVDATLFQRHGKIWLLTNIAVPGSSTHDELHLFFAGSLEEEFQPHPNNPVVSDVRRARPAGALFFEEGKLIRPSQDCSLRYGAALVLNEVEVLSETDYRERPFARIGPDWFSGSICTHTYNRTDRFEALDGMVIKRPFMLRRGQS